MRMKVTHSPIYRDAKLPLLYAWGDPEQGAVDQLKTCVDITDTAAPPLGALMADNHIGYSMPIGGVIAYYDKVSPSGVGYDIACGNKAVMLDTSLSYVHDNIGEMMDVIFDTLSFGMGLKNKERLDNEFKPLEKHPAWGIKAVAPLKELAQEIITSIFSLISCLTSGSAFTLEAAGSGTRSQPTTRSWRAGLMTCSRSLRFLTFIAMPGRSISPRWISQVPMPMQAATGSVRRSRK